jgi:hypothetical protein
LDAWIPEADVIAATGASRRNLKYWRAKGLLPEIHVPRLGKAHGTGPTDYRSWAIPIVKRIMAIRGKSKLDAYRWALWLDDGLPPDAAAWCAECVRDWSREALKATATAVEEAGPAETRNRFMAVAAKLKRRRRGVLIQQIHQRLDDAQWRGFMTTLAALVSRRRLIINPQFLDAANKLTGQPTEVLMPRDTSSIAFDPHKIIANAKPEEIEAARKLWLRHFGGFNNQRPAEPPPDWATALIGNDWREFPMACAFLLAGLIAFSVRGAP